MLLTKFRNILLMAVLSVAGLLSGSCSLLQEDLPECPAMLQVRFVFDYNLLETDAFPSQVKSVHVWAFDKDGKFVWHGTEAGEPLTRPGYVMETPLGEGTYDFVAWCGLDVDDDFQLGTFTPTNKAELDMKLKTLEKDGLNVSSSHFKGLYHGMKTGFVYTIDPLRNSIQTVTIPLIKDTNDIVVMLVNEDLSPINRDDFTVRFSYADSWLAWDNAVEAASPTVDYTPWSTLYGETTINNSINSTSQIIRSTLMYELSTSRLMENGDAYLDVYRNEDNERIIHVPLIEYFLLEKGNRYDRFGDQEYLDRRDDYSALFFISKDKNWYMAGGIYINSWAIVPPQHEPM